MSEKKKRLLLSLFPRATSQAAALVRIFGDCCEGGIPHGLLRFQTMLPRSLLRGISLYFYCFLCRFHWAVLFLHNCNHLIEIGFSFFQLFTVFKGNLFLHLANFFV